MTGKKALIALKGQVKDYELLKKQIDKSKYDYVIAADGGASILDVLNLMPDFVIGDMDSIYSGLLKKFKDRGVEFLKYKAEKDETDSELCIIKAIELGCDSVDFIAALRGRIDHEISNMGLLYYCKKRGVDAKILTEYEKISIVQNETIKILDKVGKTLSVIPFSGDVKSVTLKGFYYEIENHFMEFGKPRGVSNIVTEKEASITVLGESVLVIENFGNRE